MTTDRAAFEAALEAAMALVSQPTQAQSDAEVALFAIYDALVADLDREWNKATALAGESATLRAELATLTAENEQLRAALELGLGFVEAHNSQMPQSRLALMARMRSALTTRETPLSDKEREARRPIPPGIAMDTLHGTIRPRETP